MAAEQTHSYEEFAQQPFYREMDRELIRKAPRVHTTTDLATGTGAIIEHLLELGKLAAPFHVIGVDMNGRDLAIAQQKFEHYGNDMEFVKGTIESVPQIPDNSQELVTICNAIHLTDVPTVLAEAFRIATPGATLLVNSAYEKTKAYPPDSNAQRMFGILVSSARRKLKEQGHTEFQQPVQLLSYTEDEYRQMAESAGFTNVQLETYRMELTRDGLKAFCNYDEFAEGTLPGIPIENATVALVASVDEVFDRFNTEVLPRNVMFLSAQKPLQEAA